jgi:hypothetical protein
LSPTIRPRLLKPGPLLWRPACLVAAVLTIGLVLYARSGPPDLSNANLRGRNLEGANLSHSKMSRANLSGADLSHARLEGADMSVTQMVGTRLRGASLRGAQMGGANMRGADFTDADLRDADMTNADLGPPDAVVRGAHYSCNTVWPGGYNPQSGGAILDGRDCAPGSESRG